MHGTVFNIQRASIHDGPGIRTTVFMKGCGLRCYWCHNPESIPMQPTLMLYPTKCIGDGACMSVCPKGLRTAETGPFGFDRTGCVGCGACAEVCYAGAAEIAGKQYTVETLTEEASRDKPFYRNGGGVTFSGGEPLLQARFVAAVAERLRSDDISVAIDTALFASREAVDAVRPYADLFLIDCKAVDSELHRQGTGHSNEGILENLRYLAGLGTRYWIRTPLIPGFNDTEEALGAIGELIRSLPTPPEKYEIMPFHSLCSGKYDAMGLTFPAKHLPIPDEARVDWAYACAGFKRP